MGESRLVSLIWFCSLFRLVSVRPVVDVIWCTDVVFSWYEWGVGERESHCWSAGVALNLERDEIHGMERRTG